MITGGEVKAVTAVTNDYAELRVADYQRNYNWEREQILDLWSDLIETVDTTEPHFFGSLILEKKDAKGGRNTAEVVDGQQRLTTLIILVARLRDELLRIGGDDRIYEDDTSFSLLDELNKFIGLHPQGTKFIANLLIRDEFQKALKPPTVQSAAEDADAQIPDMDSEGRDIKVRSRDSNSGATLNFRKAFHFLRKLVLEDLAGATADIESEDVPAAKKARIYKLWLALSRDFKVLTIATSSQSESLEVFLTTNDRGLDLGVMDLVRGKVLSAISKRAKSDDDRRQIFQDQLASLEKISEQVGSSKQIDQFLRQWLHLRPETRTENKDGVVLYHRLTMKKVPDFIESLIRNAVENGTTEEKIAKNIWDDIALGASIYPRVLGETDDNKIGSDTLLRLLALKSATKSYRVLALRAYNPKLDLSKEQLREITKELLNTVFSYTLAGGNAQELETELQKLAHALKHESDVPDVIAALKKWRATRELKLEHLVSASDDSSWSRGLLLAIAAFENGNKGALRHYEVEHIAPQTSNDYWREELGLNGAAYKQAVSQIGNLILLDKETNNEVKRSPFEKKAKEYASSNVEMARNLGNKGGVWRVKEIEARTSELLNQLLILLK